MMYLGQDAIGLNHMITSIGSVARVESGTFSANEDTDISTITIQHSLGILPDFMFIITSPFDVPSTSTKYLIQGYFCHGNSLNQNVVAETSYWYELLYGVNANTGSSRSAKKKENLASQTTFTFMNLSNSIIYFKANTTYYYIIGKFNEQEVTSNA